MNRGIIYSVLLHSAFLLVLIFGLPTLYDEKILEDTVVTVEILPISEMSNVKSAKSQPTPPKPAPPKPEPVKKVEPKPTPPEPKSEPKVEPKPTPKVEPVKAEDVVSIKPAVKPESPKKVEKKKPDPKPVAKKPTPKPKPSEPKKETPKKPDLFASLEKDLQKTAEEKQQQDAFDSLKDSLTKKTTKTYDPSVPLSLSETDAIRQQFYECWTPPIGARDLENMFAVVNVIIEKDGTVKNVQLEPNSRFAGDGFYQVFAESAVRAVHKCSPLKVLPPAEKFANWHEMELTFNPKDMF